MKRKKSTLKIAHFSLVKTPVGEIRILPIILEVGSKLVRNATAVIDSNGFGGVAICSHKDHFDEETGVLMALDYRDKARAFHETNGVKLIVAKNQDFPAKTIRDCICEYLAKATEETENVGIISA